MRRLHALLLWVLVTLVPINGWAQDTTGPVAEGAQQQDTVSQVDGSGVEPNVPINDEIADLPGIDYDAWERLATRTEDALRTERASNAAFETLRSELVDARQEFSNAQDINATLIDTLQAQIDALGPPPAEGEPDEPASIASRRATLTARMGELTAPRRAASEAYARADALIGNIDALLRERQASELLKLGPSPLNPTTWPDAVGAALGTYSAIAREVRTAAASPVRRNELRESLPAVILFVALAAILLVPGRRWVERMGDKLKARARGRTVGLGAASFVSSVAQLTLPLLGAAALVSAAHATGLLNLRSTVLVNGLFSIAFGFFVARWVARRIFPAVDSPRESLIPVTPIQHAEARIYASLLGALVGLLLPIQEFADLDGYSAGTLAVLSFPVTVLGGVLLFRLGQIIAAGSRPVTESEAGYGSFRITALRAVGQLAMGIGIVAPVVAAVGYQGVAEAFLWPSVTTLALIGIWVVLSRVATETYALVTRKDEEALEGSLLPVLFTFLLAFLAIPLLALIWGMRVEQLIELWTRIKAGFQVGGVTISPSNFLTFAIVFAIGYVVTRLVQQALASSVLPKTKLDLGGRNAVRVGVGYVGIFLAALIAITTAGIDLSSLAIVAGALSVGIGFGLQTIVSNFVSGIILLVERPISEGDWIKVGDQMGFVRDISVRATRIETFDRTDVIVPNADLISGQVTNYTHGNSVGRLILPVGVAYGTDTRLVDRVLREIVEAHPLISVDPAPQVLFVGLGASSLDFEVRAILPDVKMILTVQNDLLHEITARFGTEGIEIPFAQTDIWFRNPEDLPGGSGAATTQTPHAAQPSDEPPVPPKPVSILPDQDDLDNGSPPDDPAGEGDD